MKEFFVRVLYNGKVLLYGKHPQEYVPLRDFEQFVQHVMPLDYEKECLAGIPPEEMEQDGSDEDM